jgi:hypothetical protein
VSLYRLDDPGELAGAPLIVAFDAWVDAGGASSTAADHIAKGGSVIATFDADALFDYRARRPTLEIQDGRLADLNWPTLEVHRASHGGRNLLVLSGAEPDYRWRDLADSVVELALELQVGQWISLGAIPAAVPHTRPVPILGTESAPGLLRGDVSAGPSGLLRVPAAALSVIEMAVAAAGIPSVGYFAQIPHYVSGPYAPAALALLRAVGTHLDLPFDLGELEDEAGQLRQRLDAATASEDTTRAYVERLESMVDESRRPAGEDLISEIERFLREGGSEGGRST